MKVRERQLYLFDGYEGADKRVFVVRLGKGGGDVYHVVYVDV